MCVTGTTEEETSLELSKLGHGRSRQWKLPPLQGPKGEAQGGECGGPWWEDRQSVISSARGRRELSVG